MILFLQLGLSTEYTKPQIVGISCSLNLLGSYLPLPSVPDGRPQNLRIEPLSPEELKITWQPPSEEKQNGVIIGYETTCIYQCEGNCDEEEAGVEVRKHSIKTLQLEWTLGSLKEDSMYSCESRAFTAVGPGPSTNPSVGRTEKKPVSKSK